MRISAISQEAGSSGDKSSMASLVKRKLYRQESPTGSGDSKRQRLDDDFFLGHIHDENSCDGFREHPKECQDVVAKKQKEGEAIQDYATPLKMLQNPAPFHSPTMNMPNYVLDPQPRTPLAKADYPLTPKTPNWLMQMQQKKKQSASKGDSETDANCDETKLKVKHTPSSRTKKVRLRLYFSTKVG